MTQEVRWPAGVPEAERDEKSASIKGLAVSRSCSARGGGANSRSMAGLRSASVS